MHRIVAVLIAALSLAGCAVAPFGENVQLPKGPEPEVTGKVAEGKLACVARNLTKAQRQVAFGVVGGGDKTGKANYSSNDGTGAFNTQGGADMAISSLGRTGVRLVELDPVYRGTLDWFQAKAGQELVGDGVSRPAVLNVRTQEGSVTETTIPNQEIKGPDGVSRPATLKVTTNTPPKTESQTVQIKNIPLRKGTLYPARYVIMGSITGTDFLPGGGINGGAAGLTAGYEQNRIAQRLDMRLVEFPVGDSVGGRIVATTTVKKQVVQDGIRLQLTRYFGDVKPQLINLEAGAQRREPVQDSMGDLIDLAVGDLLEQKFNLYKCRNETVVSALN
ncbi:MAG: hypothetical protein JWL87_377 [Candidatus Adlerbacteria bacterium]|nr:hypothetical protein [Candidatus Adlerbacteria bacterium]